jgi:PAS domain S-box-containing protein
MPEGDKLLELARQLTVFDLPLGVYLVTREGRFVQFNRRVREILDSPGGGPLGRLITDYYCNPHQREELKQKLEEAEKRDRWLERQTISFKVGGREIFVQDYTRSIRDPETNEVLGYLCCLVDVSEEERYRQLFKDLPIGVYQLDENDRCVHVNQAVVEMLGYKSAKEIEGRKVQDFYANPDEAREMRELMENLGSVVNKKVELIKKDGEPIFVSLSALNIHSPDGEYAGREGTMMDVTTEERYRRILEDVPVGLYVVKSLNGEDIITHCNEQFAAINEFNSRHEAIGFRMRELHATPGEYARFISSLKDSGSRDEPLHGYALNVKSRKGSKLVFEVNSRLLTDRRGKIIGRAGAVRDITEEAALRRKVTEVTEDIGNVLHTYSSTLLTLQHLISPVIQSMRPDPFDEDKEMKADLAVAALNGPTEQLASSLQKLTELARSEDRSSALPDDDWHVLSHLLQILRDVDQQITYTELRPPTIAEAANKIVEVCGNIQKGKFPKEVLRQVRNDAQELLRICNLIALHRARDVIIEMDHPVRALREFVTSNARKKEARSVCKVSLLISQVIHNLYGFARSRGVTFKQRSDSQNVMVEVIERDVIRALGNLLHNAIKYSWSRKEGEHPWILIHTFTENGYAHVAFENWGVPIPKGEIERGLVFHLGYRGKLSSDRGRVGTGIGLTDARRVARDHDGDVTIVSRPALFGGREDDYKQPFLTTVTLILPVHSKQREKGEKNEA